MQKFSSAVSVLCFSLIEAVTAVYRTVIFRLERNFRLFAAVCTNHLIHLTLLATLTAAAAFVTAVTAAGRLVLKALLCIEFLFTSGEDELFATFFARECLVLESHKIIPLLKNRITR